MAAQNDAMSRAFGKLPKPKGPPLQIVRIACTQEDLATIFETCAVLSPEQAEAMKKHPRRSVPTALGQAIAQICAEWRASRG